MLNSVYLKKQIAYIVAIIISLTGYYYFAYKLIRSNFNSLLLCFTGLFLLFIYLNKKEVRWKTLVLLTIIFRVVFLTAIPNLSQDFYRFIWDGRMLVNGLNPYLFLPEDYLNSNYIIPNQAAELVKGMGELNASHYSNYPPLNQLCFAIAAIISNNNIIGSVVIMRVLIILSDIGVMYFGTKLLKTLHLNPKAIFLYLLNPLIIIELTGNLHFEGIMIFFLLWGLYLIKVKKWNIATIPFASSISLKLIPILFLPLFFKQLKNKKLLYFYCIIVIISVLYFTPFISENLISNYARTIGLWFGKFEFNGSIHNIIKYLAKHFNFYNIVKILGKTTPVLVIIFVIILSVKQQKNNFLALITNMLFALSFYLFCASTVHPWYLAMLLILSIFTKYRFPLVWTFTIVLSYSFYKNEAFVNNYWLISIEYLTVFGFLIWELFYKLEFN
jgi:alpha-1,6-mannosyltransferase